MTKPLHTYRRCLGPVMVAALCWLLTSAASAADAREARFLKGLRDRRLFVLAENYCIERLSKSQISATRRAELTIELSRSYAEHALHAEAQQQPELWAKAIGIAADFVQREKDSPRLPVVQMQAGLVSLAQAQWRRELAEDAGQAADMAAVRTETAAAIKRFADLDAALANLLIDRNRSPRGRPDELSVEELRWLQHNARYHHAMALMNNAQTWPAGSPDRADALNQALTLLAPLASTEGDDDLLWQARVKQITALRLLQDYAKAGRELGALADKQIPADIRWSIDQEALRLTTAQGNVELATQIVSQVRNRPGVPPAAWKLAELEFYIAAWKAAAQSRDATAARWQSRADELVQAMEGQYGPYWLRKAHALLANTASAGLGGESLAILSRAAEALFRGGQLDQAVAAYDRARQRAIDEKKPREAFDLGYVAATIEHERQNFDSAKTRYRDLALQYPQHERAGEAHLLAIYDAGQAARAHSPVSLDEYSNLLAEHLKLWPVGATASQANYRLGRVHESEQRWEQAISAYAAVRASHESYLEALAAIERCYDRWIDATVSAKKPAESLITAATQHFESLLRVSGGRLPQRWDEAQRLAALAAARLRLRDPQQGAAAAETLLSAALKDPAGATDQWIRSARGLLICALAAQEKYDRAAEVLQQFTAGAPRETLALLADLGRLADSAGPDIQARLARFELQAAASLDQRRAELASDDQRQLDLARSQALLTAGETVKAIELLRQLATAHPRDGKIQESFAAALSAGADKSSWEEALTKWRELEKNSRPGSDRWYRAKYHLALAHERLGNRSQAASIINLTKVLHPELGGPELKAKFLELLARCQ